MTVQMTPRLRAIADRASSLAGGPVGTEHLLLALLEDPRAIATQVLGEFGVVEAVADRLRALLASDGYRTPTTTIHDVSVETDRAD